MKKRSLIISLLVLCIFIVAGGVYQYQTVQAEKDKQYHSLLSFIQSGNEDKAEKLLNDNKTKAFINKESEEGYTPLEYALQMQFYSLSKNLLERGADVSPESDNPLFIQLAYSLDNVQQMQDKEKQKAKNEMFKMALKKAESKLNEENDQGNTALHIVALKGDADLLALFINHGANPSSKNRTGETPLMLAVQEGNMEASKVLIESDKGLTKVQDQEGNSLVTIAVIGGRTDLVKLLTQTVIIPIDSKNELGKTALMYASEFGEKEQVQLLLDAGADKSLKSSEGNKAYDYAKEWNHKAVMKLLK